MGLQIKEILAVAENILNEAGIRESKVDSQIILSYVINYDERRIFMNWSKEIEDDHCELFFELIQHRAAGAPTQYITRRQDFMGSTFYVDNRVLIPRMDTEVLVESVLRYIRDTKGIQRVMDMCTGSGIIAVSLAQRIPSLKITAVDIDGGALDVAYENSLRHKVDNKIEFVESDLFEDVTLGFGAKKYDLIVANPPYIKSGIIPSLQREILNFEPMHALDGGVDGLDFYRRILEEAPNYLVKGGALFFEIGYDQAFDVSTLITDANHYDKISVIQDLSRNDRVIFTTLSKKK